MNTCLTWVRIAVAKGLIVGRARDYRVRHNYVRMEKARKGKAEAEHKAGDPSASPSATPDFKGIAINSIKLCWQGENDRESAVYTE